MTMTSQIPASVRDIFRRIPEIDEHRHLFSHPTCPLLEPDSNARIEAVRRIGGQAIGTNEPHPAYRFMMEAQLEALEDTLMHISKRHPERFRETERGLDLLKNLEILLNGARPGDCGPAGT